jgi:hypothetical protein
VPETIFALAVYSFALFGFATAAHRAWRRIDGVVMERRLHRDSTVDEWMRTALVASGAPARVSPNHPSVRAVRRDIARLADTDLADIVPMITKEH